MSERDPDHAYALSGRLLRQTGAALLALLLLLAAASCQVDLGARGSGSAEPSRNTAPAEVAPAPGLSLDPVPDSSPVAQPVGEQPRPEAVRADPQAVRRALRRLISAPALGRRVAVAVTQLPDGRTLLRSGPDRVVPASTLKLLTAGAALATLGGDHRFPTTVVEGAGRRAIVLVGGGDPFLASTPPRDEEVYPARADLRTLAKSTARSLRELGRTRVRLGYDASLFTGPEASPHWEASYLPDDVVSPIGALWVEEGREPDGYSRSTDPAADAARVFAKALRARGIAVVDRPEETRAGPGAFELGRVEGAPLAQVVERVLDVSDNEAAEVLFRQVAVATGAPASFAGASRAVRAVLAGVGVDARRAEIHDGSGLSRKNRLMPETLLELLRVAASAEHDELRPLLTGLPVARFTGSLASRFHTGSPLGPGVVRAKTGTLTGVHGLAGTLTTRDGVVLGFVASADRVRVPRTLQARAVLDRIGAALAGCRCAATVGAGP